MVSGFKNFENSTIIYEPDQIKNEMFSVLKTCMFSQLLQFQFSVGPDSTAIFGHATFQSFQKLRNMTHFARTLETGAKKTELAQELTINKKSLFSLQSS